ncbi:S8 family serine peptidase [Algoriphagus boritolerans]|uniref:S8 family serine peptidase n=1 Tax=Algoriphagus boritolerans TaxID=308111 RepID=UPI000B17395F
MRNVLIWGVFTFLLVSCAKSEKSNNEEPQKAATTDDPLNLLGIDSTLLIEGEYLFYLNEEVYPPIISENDSNSFTKTISEKELNDKKNAILADIETDLNLKLSQEDIFVTTFSGFFVSGISKEMADQILSETEKVSKGQQNFTIQNIRARMQGDGPVLQTIRARMQEWQYDEELHTSTGVMFVNPNSNTTNSSSKVWILDTGVDSNHQDLNVISDPFLSKSFIQSEPDPLYDLVGHGTHVAGIIGGRAHNNSNPQLLGMNGVSPWAPIVSLKVINWNGEGTWVNVKKSAYPC